MALMQSITGNNSAFLSSYLQTQRNNREAQRAANDQMRFQERMMREANLFNANEAEKDRAWQEMMSNTSHQREMKDLQEAGLNPILSANGGAAVPSGAMASSVSAPQGSKAEVDMSANSAIATMISAALSADAATKNAMTNARVSERIAQLQSDASRYATQGNMYKAALEASTSRGNNARQIAYQKDALKISNDFTREMRQYDRETSKQLKEQDLWNQEYMAYNYPNNMFQASAVAGKLFGSIREQRQNQMLSTVLKYTDALKKIFQKNQKYHYGKF